jgi:hypothetical protein
MKMSKLAKLGMLILILAVVATGTFASPNEQSNNRYAYVWVTGSWIPQKVKIKPIGTNTASAMSVWTRREIDQTGRQTTEGVLAQDPDLHVILGRPGSGR